MTSSPPRATHAGRRFGIEPRLKVDGVGQELITTDVGFVWEPLTEIVGFDRKPA